MSRTRNAGSVFWGLILITVGAIFLARNLGYPVQIWSGAARYWPILLIVWGFIKLIDYARLKQAGQSGPLFSAGEVVLLILVILSGTALTTAANLSPDLGYLFEMANVDLWDITGNSYEFSEHYEQEATRDATIDIINRYGNVAVTPADTDRIVVDVAKTVVAANEKEAAEFSRELVFSITQDGNRYRVQSNFNRDQNRIRGRRFKTSLSIKVPKRSVLGINNRNGDVEVSDLIGNQKVANGFGRVTVRRIEGAVDVDSRNDSVLVEDIKGPAVLNNQFSDIQAKNIGGALAIRHHNGNVEASGVQGDTRINSSFGRISAADIRGTLNIEARNAAVAVERVTDAVTVKNQFESVRLEDAMGGVTVDNRNGEVSLKYTQPPRKDIRVTSQFADVVLSLPSTAAFSIDARTRWAEASTDFKELNQRADGERKMLSGQVGSGGPEIRIDNRNGSIRVEK